jgi:hypothetical protein
VQELIRIGDPAVPALIDTIARDDRPTRTRVESGKVVSQSRIVSVSEVALTAVSDILRVRVVELASGSMRLGVSTPEDKQQTVKRLRAYWRKYGALSFDERMMAILTDPTVSPLAWRKAAVELSRLTDSWVISGNLRSRSRVDPKAINPAIARFQKPTAAQAILSALDRDHGPPPEDGPPNIDPTPEGVEQIYLQALVDLGDKRVAPELARRFDRARGDPVRQRMLAEAACELGNPGPLKAFARAFAAGSVGLPGQPSQERKELGRILRSLSEANFPEAEQALHSLTNTGHRYHSVAVANTLYAWPWGMPDDVDWFHQPISLALLRCALEDERDSGAVYQIKKSGLVISQPGEGTLSGSADLPESLREPKQRIEAVRERYCDRAALALQTLALGMPSYHPLHKDARRQLAQIRWTARHFPVAYRRLRPAEADWLGYDRHFSRRFVPAVSLERAATEADVKAGRALFHLDGQGRKAPLEVPAVGLLVQSKGEPVKVLILQAEVGPEGTVYGVVGEGVMGRFPGHRVVGVRSLKDVEKR